jgi:hypothetical protein
MMFDKTIKILPWPVKSDEIKLYVKKKKRQTPGQ